MPAVTSHLLPQPQPEAKVIVKLELPESLYEHYATCGMVSNANRTPEQEILERLKLCQNHTALRGLYFNDEQRAAIEKTTGHLAIREPEVLQRLITLLSLKVDKVVVKLSPRLQAKIRTRCFRKPYEEVLERETVAGLERFVGIRP